MNIYVRIENSDSLNFHIFDHTITKITKIRRIKNPNIFNEFPKAAGHTEHLALLTVS